MFFMSDWLVHLVQVGKFGKHPNADSLSVTQVYGTNVIFRSGTFQEGDFAVFIPPDSVLPMDPEHPLLKDNPNLKPGHRVDAVRLRGIFSNGFMVPAKLLFTEEELKNIPLGTHVADRIGVTKYQDEGDRLSTRGDNEPDPGYMPLYTDIEGWPKHKYVIPEGEEVVLTEKIHGANARFCFRDDRLWVGSRTGVKAQYVRPDGTEGNLWWNVAKNINLVYKFKNLQLDSYVGNVPTWDLVLYGEVYGQVQDLKYGVNTGANFRLFDIYSPSLGRYVDWDLVVLIANIMELELVPELYRGPWKPEFEDLRNGPSVLYPGHIREGYVIKPVHERFVQYNPENRHAFTGRVIFKFVSEDFKLRNAKKK
jgi:RNA ligase (TIGR02306 family)